MSADNWRICPKCKAVQEDKRAADLASADAAAQEAYGKLRIAQFESLRRAADKLRAAPATREETFREDFYIGTDENGLFTVDYHGKCQSEACKFTVKFKHQEQK